MLKAYIEIAKNSFMTEMEYRNMTFIMLLSGVMGMWVQVFIWQAVYSTKGDISSTVGNIGLNEMITYVLLSSCIAIFADNHMSWIIFRKVLKGEVAMDLIKPINFKAGIFSQAFGAMIFMIIFKFIPILVVGILFFKPVLSTPFNFLIFIVTFINGLAIFNLMTFIIGLLSFWYTWIWQFNRLLASLIQLFSGAFIPLWFFGGQFKAAADLLPFRFIYYTPITAYLGKYNINTFVREIGLQFLWIIILYLMIKVMWSRAVDKLVINGG